MCATLAAGCDCLRSVVLMKFSVSCRQSLLFLVSSNAARYHVSIGATHASSGSVVLLFFASNFCRCLRVYVCLSHSALRHLDTSTATSAAAVPCRATNAAQVTRPMVPVPPHWSVVGLAARSAPRLPVWPTYTTDANCLFTSRGSGFGFAC